MRNIDPLKDFNFTSNDLNLALSQKEVDEILAYLVGLGEKIYGLGRTVTIIGYSSKPSAEGNKSAAILICRGVTVITN